MIALFFLGFSIAFFLFFLTIIKKNKRSSDWVLASWMFFMTMHIGLFLLDHYEVTYKYPHLLGVILPFPILHGFFLYWYTSLATGSKISTGSVMLHLLPFVILATLGVPFYMLPASEKIQVYRNAGAGFEWYSLVQAVLFITSGFAYSIASVLKIKRYRIKVLDRLSNTENGTLLWLQYIAYGFAGVWAIAYPSPDDILFLGVSFFVLFIGAYAINRTDVFITHQDHNPETEVEIEKYQRSGLNSESAAELSSKLKIFMETSKPFKNANLTLDELAAMLDVNSNHLSQVINTREGRSFYHYVNSYRIKEFLLVACDPSSRKLTYAGLASECGFQSKTTFNKYFKLETGKTPSEYFEAAPDAVLA